jgi:hypothetical protein
LTERRNGRVGVGLIAIGGVVMVGAMFGPWVRSGSNRRNSFELVDLIDRLGFTPDGPVAVALRSWPLAPLAVVVTVVLTVWIGGRVMAVLAFAVGLTVGAIGLAVRRVPESALIGGGWGSSAAAIGGLVMAGGGVTMLVSRRASQVPEAPLLQDVT